MRPNCATKIQKIRKDIIEIVYQIFEPDFLAFKKESNIKLKKAISGRITRNIYSSSPGTAFKKLMGVKKI